MRHGSPLGCRAARRRARLSRSGPWLASAGSSSTAVTIVSGPTNRVMSSTCPSVSSPSMPSPSHSDLLHAEVRAQRRLEVRLRRARIAIGVQQALLGREHGAGAVHVDRAAFEDEPRFELRDAGQLVEPRGHRGVAHQRLVLAAPRVEAPVIERQLPLWSEQEVRAVVANPRVDGLDLDQLQVLDTRGAPAGTAAGRRRRRRRCRRAGRRARAASARR